jgi:hypothetical protein
MLTSGIQIGAILHYDGASDSEPASTGVTLKTTCADEQGLTPWVKNMVPSEPLLKGIKEISLDYKVDAVQNNLFRWLINGSDMQVDWAKPSIEYALNGQSNDLPKSNIFTMPKANEVRPIHPLSPPLSPYRYSLLTSNSGHTGGSKLPVSSSRPTQYISTATTSTS